MPDGPPAPATAPAFADLLELVGRRWTLRILWELRDGPLTFNTLRRRAGGLSQSVLVTRLTELYGAGLVADVPAGYQLTADGASLAGELTVLANWATAHPRRSTD